MVQELIEVEADEVLFHLDVVLPARFSKDQRVQRFISSDLTAVVDLLTTRHPTESRVTIQSRYTDDETYRLKIVDAIYLAGSRSSSQHFLCDCEGERILVGANQYSECSAELKLIWPRPSHMSWDLLQVQGLR